MEKRKGTLYTIHCHFKPLINSSQSFYTFTFNHIYDIPQAGDDNKSRVLNLFIKVSHIADFLHKAKAMGDHCIFFLCFKCKSLPHRVGTFILSAFLTLLLLQWLNTACCAENDFPVLQFFNLVIPCTPRSINVRLHGAAENLLYITCV